MTLSDIEQYQIAEEFLIDQDILDSPIGREQYDRDPFEYFAEEFKGNQATLFRPSVLDQIEEVEERVQNNEDEYGIIFDYNLDGILDEKRYSRVLSQLTDLFEGFSRWGGETSKSSQYNNEADIDYESLRNLGKVVFTASEISSLASKDINRGRPTFERDSLGDIEEEIYQAVREDFSEFSEEKDFTFSKNFWYSNH